MRAPVLVTILVALASCAERQPDAPGDAAMEMAPALAIQAKSDAPAAPVLVALPQIAYAYSFALELPVKAVVPLFERHRRACEMAGPARCQIVGAETSSAGGTDTRATLSLRAETAWLAAFRGRLASDATAADGEVAESATTSEDLGRTISDSAARLRALTALQGRLEGLLASRTGKLADLLEIERELARVGGELDATRSALADMRGRVALPMATIVYRPDSLAVAGAGAGEGLGGNLFDVASTSLFFLLNLLAAVLPWLLLIGLPLFLLLRRQRRKRVQLDGDPPAT